MDLRMKLLWCLIAAASVLAKPVFVDQKYTLKPNVPFRLQFRGCDDGCLLVLLPIRGDTTWLVTPNAQGESFTLIMQNDMPSDTYRFKLTDNDSGEEAFSSEFEYLAADNADNKGNDGGGLSAGEIAGIVVGVIGGILLFLVAFYLWWRRSKTKRLEPGNEESFLHLQTGDLAPVEKAELPAFSRKPPAQTKPPAELSNQSQALELPAKEQQKFHELPSETIHLKMEAYQEPSNDPKSLTSSNGQLSTNELVSPPEDIISPASSSSPGSKTAVMSEIQPPQFTSMHSNEFESFVPQLSNEALLMDQYAQLETRRQRLLDLDRIEKEQAELQQRINEMAIKRKDRE